MNSKKDKIELLKAISTGEIDPNVLSSESVIVSDGKEAFAGLMISVANHKAGNKSPVIYIGEAKALIEECLVNISEKRNDSRHVVNSDIDQS
ncbi:MAG: hypothetical protein WAO52_18955 [Prolixibacteraceae bacterium]